MEALSKCPLCSSEKTAERLFEAVDYTVSQEKFSVVSCPECGFVFTNPRPSMAEIGRYYQSEEYVSHSNSSKGIINGIYQWVRKYTLVKKYQLINKHVPSKGMIIDYGCGTGEFLGFFKQNGWNTKGFEPDEKARKMAAENHALDVDGPEKLSSFSNSSADVITLWHVLEHVHDLQQTFKTLLDKLKPGGLLVLALPNHRSNDASSYRADWAAYDVPRHLYHFDRSSVARLASSYDLKSAGVLPMVFDSFYVSMLSEKNKKSGLAPVKGAWRGLVSNMAAASSGEYSSLIYLFRKPVI